MSAKRTIDEIPRLYDIRDKNKLPKIPADYTQISKHFYDNINDVKSKFKIAEALEGTNREQAKEIWRSQIVFLESSLDFYIHEVIKFGIIKMFNGEWTRTDQFNEIKVSLKFAIGIAESPETEVSLLKEEIDTLNQRQCFMGYANIKKQLEVIGISVDSSKKTILNDVYKRRNQIAHQSDRLPDNPTKQDISKDLVENYINEIEAFVKDIDSKVKEK